jgi:hypothetical protein
MNLSTQWLPAGELLGLAVTILQARNNNPVEALPEFLMEIRKRPALLDAVALSYLRTVSHTTQNASQSRQPPKSCGPKKKGPTEIERAAERAVMAKRVAIYDTVIAGRKLGDIVWGELSRLHDSSVRASVRGIAQGYEEAYAAVLFEKLQDHAVVTDHTRKVADVVKKATLERLSTEARVEATRRIALATQRAAEIINHQQPQLN